MGYFPFFVDLSGREGLIAGGGKIALRKAEKLLPFGPRLTVAAPELLPELEALPGVTALRRPFEPAMLENKAFAVAATDDRAENRRIASLCQERGILVNVVDDRDWCGFLFPALVRRGSLTAGVTTGGASPAAAGWVRRQVEELLPENFGDLLAFLDSRRETVRQALSREGDRARFFRTLLAGCLTEEPSRWEAEFDRLLEEASKEADL